MAASRRSSSRPRWIRRGCLAVIALLYILSVPWYREAVYPVPVWLGLPDWVAVAVLCYVAVAFLNAIAWTVTEVPDVLDGGGEEPAEPGPGEMPQ